MKNLLMSGSNLAGVIAVMVTVLAYIQNWPIMPVTVGLGVCAGFFFGLRMLANRQ